MAPSGKVRRKSGGEGRKWPAGTKIKRAGQVSDEKTASGRNKAPRRGGNSHLSSGAEGAKEKGDGRAGVTPNETTLPG